MPEFSIILPTYNVGEYIDRCLESCLNQSFKNFEVIVVDDCGQDDSIAIAQLWADKDCRIKLVHHKRNLGTFHARRTGVESASGKYILFLDPDDYLEINALEALRGLTIKTPDMLLFGIRQVPKQSFYQMSFSVPVIKNFKYTLSKVEKLLNWKGFSLGTPGKAYKKELVKHAFKNLGISDEVRLIYGEDAFLFAKVLLSVNSIESTQEQIYLYCLNENSITQSDTEERLLRNAEQLSYVVERLEMEYGKDGVSNLVLGLIVRKLKKDQIALLNKTKIGFASKFSNYLKLLWLDKSAKSMLKLVIFIVTLGNKSL